MGPRGPVRLKLKRSKQTKQDGNQRYIWRCPDPKTGCFDQQDIGVRFYLEMSCDRNVTDSHTTKLYFYANLKPMVISFSLIYKYTNANTEIQIQIQRLGLGYDEMWVAGSLGPITLITQ